jgi:hypothetical protein
MMSIWSAIRERWQAETDGAGLAIVRIAVGVAVLIEVLEAGISAGVTELLVEPQVEFKYAFFKWLARPQGLMPYVLVWVLASLAAAVLVGWRTRWTALLLALGYAYWFLIDAANYSDHGYLVCVLAVLVAWLPTNRWASVDAYLGRENRTMVPGWTVELLRTQLIIVYSFFGLALLSQDWFTGAPLIAWVEIDADSNPLVSLISGHTTLVRAAACLLPVVYLTIGPLLCWRRTRLAALIAITAIQLFDQLTFQISISPLLMSASNLIFCDPTHLRKLGNWLVAGLGRLPLSGFLWAGLCKLGWVIDGCVSWFDDTPLFGATDASSIAQSKTTSENSMRPGSVQSSVAKSSSNVMTTASPAPQWAIVLWLIIQLWMPVRYITLEKHPDWSDMATTFAWRGQHRDKQCTLKLYVIQTSQELEWPLDPTEEFPVPMAIFYTEQKLESLGLSEGALKDLIAGPESTLADRISSLNLSESESRRIFDCYQSTVKLRLAGHQYEQVVQRPELIRQYAHRIAEVLTQPLGERVQVQADLQIRLNHRPAEPLFRDRTKIDLAEVNDAFELASSIARSKEPLPELGQRIAYAKQWAEQRRIELEEDFDIISAKHPRTKGEPVKLPAISDEDERWFQKKWGR